MQAKPKSILSLLCLLAITSLFTGCGEEEDVISEDQMQTRGILNRVYAQNSDIPFTGVVVRYYENGQKEWERRYKSGWLHGISTDWFENGQKYAEGTYNQAAILHGGKDGTWKVWDNLGFQVAEWTSEWNESKGVYVKKGRRFRWRGNGHKAIKPSEVWAIEEFDELGEKVSQVHFYEGGSKSLEESYKDGKKHGICQEWYRNGKKKFERNYFLGDKVGQWREWSETGELKLREWYAGNEKHGSATRFFSSGSKMSECRYANGAIDGKKTEWYESGQMRLEGSYKNGQRDGKWTYWNDRGQVTKGAIYEDGELIEEKTFSPE